MFDVPPFEYMQNFIAISTGATISPYLSPWRGLWPKYFSEKIVHFGANYSNLRVLDLHVSAIFGNVVVPPIMNAVNRGS